ncbi:uncharacterized oxidoreductase YjmC-like isoform X2 [Periplaneta americana]|uniref:uncharacterized oxidoreductase YjmC-like isoform X2 n=1 Tax=Periplaneta americana TaxID=6978 RepID=UPI0037E727BA
MVAPIGEVRRFLCDALCSVGASYDSAVQLADVLVDADYKGHYSHGLNRIELYIRDVKKKLCDPDAKPFILKETPSTAWVDGKGGFGPVVGNFCMELAIQKAKNVGVGWVAANHSNHFGIAGWYSRLALQHGMLGMSFTNTSPVVSPTRAKTIEVQRRKGEPIVHGWAQDAEGLSTTDAVVALKTLCLMPLGGPEITSGYKGYGLSLMVETLCGVLSGSSIGPDIRLWHESAEEGPNLGQCFIAIDPQCFAPGFEDRMSSIMDYLRGMEPADPSKPVLVPGDPERNHMQMVDEQGGIRYHENQLEASVKLAAELGIRPMKLL